MPLQPSKSVLRPLAIALLGACAIRAGTASGAAWIENEEYGSINVVIPGNASSAVRYGAHRFSGLWEQCTGFAPTVSTRRRDDRVNVWIGDAPDAPRLGNMFEGSPADSFVIRTLGSLRRRGSGRALVIAANTERATIQAVFTFFERVMGVRWYTPSEVDTPEPPESIDPVEFRYAPPFVYRDISYKAFVDDVGFALLNGLNGFWSGIPAELGGHISYVRGWPGLGHTFLYFVPREEYFENHPEYYSEVLGLRVAYETQLCLTNPDVLAITIEKTRQLLRDAAPNERIVSISQMDWENWCTCSECAAVDAFEESHSGTIVRFVNAVAEAVAGEFPDAYVDTFAYAYSRKPPKHARPRDNVIIRLTTLGAEFGKPLNDPKSLRNRAFMDDLRGWPAITKNLYIWDYTQNFNSFIGPHPNYHVLQANLETFAKHGVDGVFEQASPYSTGADFEELKAYLLGRAIRYPREDWRPHYRNFLKHFYGEGSPFVDQYLDLIAEHGRRPDAAATMYNSLSWLDYDAVAKAQAIFERAFDVVHDEPYRQRLERAYLPVQYAALVCPPRVTRDGARYVLERPPSPSLEEFMTKLEKMGVTHLADRTIDALPRRLGGRTPARRWTTEAEILENDFNEVWIVPNSGGEIIRFRDKAAEREWLAGYEHFASTRGRIVEWTGYRSEGPYGDMQNTLPYRIVSRSAGGTTMETVTTDGFRLLKTIELDEAGPGLTVTLEIENVGDAPRNPDFALNAEFNVHRMRSAKAWSLTSDGWTPWVDNRQRADHLRGEPLRKWAVTLSKRGAILVHTIHEPGIAWVGFQQNLDGSSLLVRHDGQRRKLAPGESRRISVSYNVQESLP